MEVLNSMDANKAVPKDDIPTKIFKRFSVFICKPLADLITECISKGVWPDFLKIEAVTPVPKVANMRTAKDLRKICGLPNLSKIKVEQYYYFFSRYFLPTFLILISLVHGSCFKAFFLLLYKAINVSRILSIFVYCIGM